MIWKIIRQQNDDMNIMMTSNDNKRVCLHQNVMTHEQSRGTEMMTYDEFDDLWKHK